MIFTFFTFTYIRSSLSLLSTLSYGHLYKMDTSVKRSPRVGPSLSLLSTLSYGHLYKMDTSVKRSPRVVSSLSLLLTLSYGHLYKMDHLELAPPFLYT